MDTAVTQYDLNTCAASIHEQADLQLNAVYAEAVAAARDADAQAEEFGSDAHSASYGIGTAEEQLRAAQRAWMSFRDLDCDAYAKRLGGGTWLSMQHASCLASMTQERTEQLRIYVEGGGGGG
jgi:uncharacterized protein YecT (DUF1311 family)